VEGSPKRLTTMGTLMLAPVPDLNSTQREEGAMFFVHGEKPLFRDSRATARGAGAATHVSDTISVNAGGWGSDMMALALR